MLRYADIDNRIFNFKVNDMILHTVLRPYYREFLEFCFKYFHRVIVWSAGEKEYVERIVERLFLDLPSPDLVLSRNDCLLSNNVCTKPLGRITIRKGFETVSLTNTIVIDDNPKATVFNPRNAIHIPPFNPLYDFPPALLKLMDWLMRKDVREVNDVSNLDKTHIF
jgi:TFIIF-interacting CTD phosphatase-like protein